MENFGRKSGKENLEELKRYEWDEKIIIPPLIRNMRNWELLFRKINHKTVSNFQMVFHRVLFYHFPFFFLKIILIFLWNIVYLFIIFWVSLKISWYKIHLEIFRDLCVSKLIQYPIYEVSLYNITSKHEI